MGTMCFRRPAQNTMALCKAEAGMYMTYNNGIVLISDLNVQNSRFFLCHLSWSATIPLFCLLIYISQ